MTSDIKNRIALSKARGPLHAADVPRKKIKRKKLAERENETPLSKNGLEKILLSTSRKNYSKIKYSIIKCIMPSQSRKQYVSAVR